jgi:hypothetical protein
MIERPARKKEFFASSLLFSEREGPRWVLIRVFHGGKDEKIDPFSFRVNRLLSFAAADH